MTTRVLPEFKGSGFLAVQAAVHDIADTARVLFVHVGERALDVLWQMGAGTELSPKM